MCVFVCVSTETPPPGYISEDGETSDQQMNQSMETGRIESRQGLGKLADWWGHSGLLYLTHGAGEAAVGRVSPHNISWDV